MKKVLIAALALMVGASISLAGMGIDWSAGYGWLVEYDGDLNNGPGAAENNDVLWQLIYAGANNVADEPNLSAANYLGGDDQLLADRTVPAGGGTSADGTSWDTWLINQGGYTVYEDLDWNTAGSVYQRIWQGTPSTETDSYYFQTDLVEINTAYDGGGAAPQTFGFDEAGYGVAVDNVIPGTQVPEPATMSLLGLGALAMVLRRKLRK